METVDVSGVAYNGNLAAARFTGPYGHVEAFDFIMETLTDKIRVRVDGERVAYWLFEQRVREQTLARNAAREVSEGKMVVCF
jgi:hypothetical protein